MKLYTGKVEKVFEKTILHAEDGNSYILRRTGKSSIKRSHMLTRLDGRTLIFNGQRMGKFLFISLWMTPEYAGA